MRENLPRLLLMLYAGVATASWFFFSSTVPSGALHRFPLCAFFSLFFDHAGLNKGKKEKKEKHWEPLTPVFPRRFPGMFRSITARQFTTLAGEVIGIK